jgi:hypothetical protein
MVLCQYTHSLATFYKPYCKPDDCVDMAWSLKSPDSILSAIQMYAQAGLMRLAGRSLESALFWTNQVGLIIRMQKDIG